MLRADARDGSRWYVVQTKPRQDGRAESNLQQWRVQTFAPKIRELRHSASGASSFRLTPLFPNYLFARFDAEALAAKIRLTRGIQRIVGFGECATPVDDAVVRVIKAQLSDEGIVRPREVQPGDAVEIIDGPLRSLVGIFERHTKARDRVVVLLDTIGCRPRVQIAKMALRKVTHP